MSLSNFADLTDSSECETRSDLTERFAAIGMIAAGVAHDLNNPLSVSIQSIDAATRALLKGDLTAAKIALTLADEASCKCAVLVSCIQSAVNPQRVRPVEIADVVTDAVALASHQIRMCARLVLDVPPGLRVSADRSRLIQLFLHLIVNAAQAMDPKRIEQNEIGVRARKDDRTIVVEVVDTGHGIPAHVVPRIFDAFFTTKPKGRGTGLGLFVSAQIARSLDGSIRADSVEGCGATFHVLLPASDTPDTSRDSGIIPAQR